MTIEETIYALDIVEHMESFSVLYEPGEPMNQTTVGKLKEACRMAVSILRVRTDTPPNDPLTLEELREMDGEPVYVTSSIGEQPMWYIVDIEDRELKNPWDRITLEEWDEGYPYKAYRRRPESGAP